MKYIATFYSHFGAIRFKKICEKKGNQATLMPVPRDLSSSCGTCVAFFDDEMELKELVTEEIEQIVRQNEEDGKYELLYKAADS